MHRKKNAVRVGYDGSGHLDPNYTQQLLELGHAGPTATNDEAFVNRAFTDDDLAEELAEAAVTSMTTGEDELIDQLEVEVEEELGGPFVETSARVEFASGTDESNILEATREPFPTPNGSDDS
jgi:hypothetical protein